MLNIRMKAAEIQIALQSAPKVRQVTLAKPRNPDYQRPLDDARVARIVKNFDINKVRPPLLIEDEEGNLDIVDGKHTVEALKQVGFTYWPVCLVAPMNRKEAIHRFTDQLDNVRKPKPEDRLHAASLGFIEPGGHADDDFRRAHEIRTGIELANWIFDPSGKKAPMTISTSSGIEEVYDEAEAVKLGSGQNAVTEVLADIQETWPHDPAVSADANLHRAFGKLLRAYGPFSHTEKIILLGIPSNTFAQITKGMGSQSEKRDTICCFLIKALGRRRNKKYYAA